MGTTAPSPEADGPYQASDYLVGSVPPTLVFTASDVLEIRSLCGTRTVEFEPSDLTITRVTSDHPARIDPSWCG